MRDGVGRAATRVVVRGWNGRSGGLGGDAVVLPHCGAVKEMKGPGVEEERLGGVGVEVKVLAVQAEGTGGLLIAGRLKPSQAEARPTGLDRVWGSGKFQWMFLRGGIVSGGLGEWTWRDVGARWGCVGRLNGLVDGFMTGREACPTGSELWVRFRGLEGAGWGGSG